VANIGDTTGRVASPLQQSLWLHQQLVPNTAVYNVPVAVRLTGRLSIPALQQSLQTIIDRHEELRSSYQLHEGRIIQLTPQTERFALEVLDCSDVDRDHLDAEAHRLACVKARAPFDLSRGPLLRASLLRLDSHGDTNLFVLAAHHMVFDSLSAVVLARELSALYEAFSTGQTPPVFPASQQSHAAKWNQPRPGDEDVARDLSYWRETLSGSPDVLSLPTDYPRRPLVAAAGAHLQFTMPAALVVATRRGTKLTDAPFFVTVLGAIYVLLQRYTAEDDIVIGTPFSTREARHADDLIGLFTTILPLRVYLGDNLTASELLTRIDKAWRAARAHSHVSLAQIAETVPRHRSVDQHPFFSVEVAVGYDFASNLKLPGLCVSSVPVDTASSQFDITLTFSETRGQFTGDVEYRTDLFETETISRLSGHFLTTLNGIVREPSCRIRNLPFLTAPERKHLLTVGDGAKASVTEDVCVHQLFERQARETPQAIAVTFGERSLSYGELDDQASHLAAYLRPLGVGPEVLVGICTDRSIEMIVGLLGVLKAGGAYVPIAPAVPPDRLRHLLTEMRAPVVLTQQRLSAMFTDHPTRAICLDDARPEMSRVPALTEQDGVTSKNLAYVIYTSGSTGAPKGVCIEHRQIVNYVRALIQRAHLVPGYTYAMVQAFTFDSCGTVIFGALATGGTLVLVDAERAIDAKLLSDYFRRHPIDCLKITPTHLSALLALHSANVLPRRVLIVGGEATRLDWAQEVASRIPECRMFVGYGPTETAVNVLMYDVAASDKQSHTTIVHPIGTPLANTQAYVLDPHLQPVPIGIAGELYAAGLNVGRGYLASPDRTAEAFIPDPFSRCPGGRMYRTGDRVRWSSTGAIEFLGRGDDQVKIRGFRVELGEIEASLALHPAVQDVAVLAARPGTRVDRLMGCIVPKPASRLTVDDLRTFLQDKLPDYMIPAAFTWLDAMPRTTHGKIDRQALYATVDISHPHSHSNETACTATERALQRIWRDALGVYDIGLDDDFFAVGGNSLLAIQILARIQADLDTDLPLRVLFSARTITELARAVDARTQDQRDALLASAIAEVESLTDEEARLALNADDDAGPRRQDG